MFILGLYAGLASHMQTPAVALCDGLAAAVGQLRTAASQCLSGTRVLQQMNATEIQTTKAAVIDICV